MRATIAYLLITLLTCSVIPASSQPTVSEQVARLKDGEKIRVELISGGDTERPDGFSRSIQFGTEQQSAGAWARDSIR